jgi:hypothetical protein
MDSVLLRYFDLVCDKIAAHPSYSRNLEKAAATGAQLVLNYHTHGPDQDYCASVCVAELALLAPGQHSPLAELAHIRGIGKSAEECGPRMTAFAARLVERYGLEQTPLVFLDDHPFERRGATDEP